VKLRRNTHRHLHHLPLLSHCPHHGIPARLVGVKSSWGGSWLGAQPPRCASRGGAAPRSGASRIGPSRRPRSASCEPACRAACRRAKPVVEPCRALLGPARWCAPLALVLGLVPPVLGRGWGGGEGLGGGRCSAATPRLSMRCTDSPPCALRSQAPPSLPLRDRAQEERPEG
jgi:hypothetical protein